MPMEINACAQCGLEIESKGIHFRGKVFCSDECCEEFEAEMADNGDPDMDDLDDDFDPDDLGEELGYREDDDDDEDDLLDDDDYEIDPDDF